MRFVLRSAFWLAIAFAIIQPMGMDFGVAASALSERAISEGSRVAADQVARTECTSIECHGSKVVLSAMLNEHVEAPTTSIVVVEGAPFPLPRISGRG